MKKVILFALCLSSVSLYSSNRPSLEELKNSSYTNNRPSDEELDTMETDAFDEVGKLEEKGSRKMNQALGKLSRRGKLDRKGDDIIQNKRKSLEIRQ